jgi:hypothetical protein
MSWPRWLRRWVRGWRVSAPESKPARTLRPPRYAPRGAERLRDPLEEADERIERLDWRTRELVRERNLDRERYGRGRRP